MKIKFKNDVICWWSGGITSAVACEVAIGLYGIDRCRFIMIDTKNEDEDTYRFKGDCELWYGKEIEVISAIPDRWGSIQDVWYKFMSLNVASGAICSTELKREVRRRWQLENEYTHQVFGFEFTKREFNRALALKANYPSSKPVFPLLLRGYDKKVCGKYVMEAGIELPRVYRYGFKNNNCFRTGCVQGGVGYWQKMKQEFPEKFFAMAEIEHDLTDKRGKPVTILKDQSKGARVLGRDRVFLVKHKDYSGLKGIDQMPMCKVEPLFECNGFCGTNDLISSEENRF